MNKEETEKAAQEYAKRYDTPDAFLAAEKAFLAGANFVNASLVNDSGKWVSVKERKPEIGIDKEYPFASDMLLLSNGKRVYYGQYEKSPQLVGGFLDAEGNDFSEHKIKITHWQPLPEPPKPPTQ